MTRNRVINKWKKYGVDIFQESDGKWRWSEIEESDQGNLAFSPPFNSFESCILDLEHCFGPLEEGSV